MKSGSPSDVLSYDSSVNLNGNLDFQLKGSTYSEETEITSYINNIFTSVEECLEGFNKLITSANSYIQSNNNVSNIPTPDLKTLNFSVDTSGLMAETSSKVKTDGGNLNVREEGSKSSKVVGKLASGTDVKVIEKGEEWSKVSYTDSNNETKEGYVSSKYLEENSTAATSSSASNPTTEKAESVSSSTNTPSTSTKSYVVNIKDKNSKLNVRTGASTNDKIKSSLKYGEEIHVVSVDNGWAKVQIGNDPNNIGYVSAEYIKEK
ncbi:MAG: SH3 domain-containing protein [Bacilli bacterium]|nr:SH3 domain-containing protein [Bacilli bacterium]